MVMRLVMKARSSLLLLFLGLFVCTAALAESTNCGDPVLMIPDGRITQSSFSQNSIYWFGIYVQQGHSYSVEFESPADNYGTTPRVFIGAITVFAPSDALTGCKGPSSVAVTPTSGYSPVIQKGGNGAGMRIAFTAQSAGNYLIAVSNAGTAGGYSFRALDTTLVNPRWSTCGGYFTHWGLLNVSDMPIVGVLTVFGPGGRPVVIAQVNLAPGEEQFRISLPSDLNIAPNSAGYAIFSHNGPPNAIVADAYMVGGNGGVVYVSSFDSPGQR
jgi:hypothetical protein